MKSDWYAYSDRRRWGYFDEEERARRANANPAPARPAPASVSKPQQGASSPGLSRADAARAATAMVADLVAQSRAYPGIDWAVSAYEDGSATRFYAVSNEGAGFLPPGMQWDTRLWHVFGPAVADSELGPWLGLENPARTLADHCMGLRSAQPELKLVCLVSSRPVGEAVAQLQSMLCAAGPTSGGAAADPSARAATRISAIDGGATEAAIAGIPVQERWAAGLDLALGAAQLCAFHKQSPQLAGVLEGLRAGRADARGVQLVWQEAARLAAQAQGRRVPDSRLGPLDLYSAAPTFNQAMVLSAGFEYAWPFYAARVCAMVMILLRLRLDDVAVGKGHLAELAYEHVCVAEDLQATRAVLGSRSAAALRSAGAGER